MKTITPVQTWFNGNTITLSVLDCICQNDNLSTSATLKYTLWSLNDKGYTEIPGQQGILTMIGTDYISYETNQYAYDWVATQLKLTITGDYIVPTITIQP